MGHADGTPAPAPGSACFSPLPHPPPHLAWPSGGQARQVLCASRDHLHPLSAKGAHLLEFELSVVSPTSETEQGKQTTPPRPSGHPEGRRWHRCANARSGALRGQAGSTGSRRAACGLLSTGGLLLPVRQVRRFHVGLRPAPCGLRPPPAPSPSPWAGLGPGV